MQFKLGVLWQGEFHVNLAIPGIIGVLAQFDLPASYGAFHFAFCKEVDIQAAVILGIKIMMDGGEQAG
jgi:hypothetical protein